VARTHDHDAVTTARRVLGGTTPMQNIFYVMPRALQWKIFARPGNGTVEIERSRSAAIERAKILARASGGGVIVVARRDGSAEETIVGVGVVGDARG
jgi:hypothetical protein